MRSAGRCRTTGATKLIWHRGAVFGSLAAVALFRTEHRHLRCREQRGRRDDPRPRLRAARSLSRPAAGRWPERLREFRLARSNEAAKALAAPAAKPVKAGPSLPLSRYAGDYVDPWYGKISVRQAGKTLTIDFPRSKGMNGTLQPLAVRHVQDQLRRQADRAGLRDLLHRRRRAGGPGDDEGRLTDRRLQLRLSGPEFVPAAAVKP